MTWYFAMVWKAVTVEGQVPSSGEDALFCRPVVTAPASVRRDGTVLAGAWLPGLVRLGELERHLGDGVIEAIADETLEQGRLKPRERSGPGRRPAGRRGRECLADAGFSPLC